MTDPASAATSTTAIAPGKTHYAILDGLRGVAAVTVVIFHLFEAYAGGDPHRQIVNHGYLAATSSSCFPASSSPMPMTTAGAR